MPGDGGQQDRCAAGLRLLHRRGARRRLEADADALEEYGYHLGLAFQAIDDLLGIWGDPATTGKQTWSDLRQRKKSLPVVAALAAGRLRVRALWANCWRRTQES